MDFPIKLLGFAFDKSPLIAHNITYLIKNVSIFADPNSTLTYLLLVRVDESTIS